MSEFKNPVIQKNSYLFSIEIKNIDLQVLSLFEQIYFIHYPNNKSNTYLLNRFNHLLNGFSYLKKYELNSVSVLNQNFSDYWSEFLFFLKNCVAIDSSRFIRILNKIVFHLNNNFHTNILLNELTVDTLTFDSQLLKYLNGWRVKQRNSYEYLQLCEYSDIHGLKEANRIEDILNKTNQTISVSIFNEFITFLNKDKISIFNLQKHTIIEFLKYIFSKKQNIKLHSQKTDWNYFINLLTSSFSLNDKYDLKFLNHGAKKPNEMRVKNIGEKEYKDKLISLIPLEIKDEKALAILKNKINQDLSIVIEWANYVLEELKFSRLTQRCLNASDYNLSPLDVRKKYGLKAHNKTKDFFDKDTIFNEIHLFAICSLLIEQHPSITESFLAKCNVETSLVDGIYSSNSFLISNKSRRGAELAEQKIALNSETKNIIQNYLSLTKDLRDNLNNSNHKFKDIMFICCSNNHPLNIKQPLDFKTSYVQKNIHNFLINKGYSDEDSQSYSNSISLTKIRATKAIKIYFETENTSKMAEALGHHKYNANLLSHYLPKSILDFFQERWIRIFQKGIILESVKDSPHILEITKFNNMHQVEEFLKNHTFKFKETTDTSITNNENLIDNKTSYISINEINLYALASLHDAVQKSDKKSLISETAFYWSAFYEKLLLTIQSDYTNFSNIVEKANNSKNSTIFSEVIYA